ncbi:MAG: hypothetical protein H0W24_08195 [Lysobacter sp.]|nr:hypothetical protein [Lysobacter sp.]
MAEEADQRASRARSQHLERDFEALEPNTKLVTDITYIRTAECWLHLVVLDLYVELSHRQQVSMIKTVI